MIEIHDDFLPQNTRKVFLIICNRIFMRSFILVGGTALALQIKHRFSEDLDFIIDSEALNTGQIKRNIARTFKDYRIIREEPGLQIDIIVDDVKMTWFSAGTIAVKFRTADHSFRYQNILIAKPEIIAVHKILSISQRNTFRDYYDLYILAKYHIPLEKIFNLTRKLYPELSPVTYSETLIYTDDIPEVSIASHLNPREVVTREDISGFFIEELRRIKTKLQ